ncbi:MAG: N-acetylmuramoyl-L-alanine amidase [Verrucomicrobia bacterium]|nr:N-acetylmuramoyl-L-alanine amidase [Verrucomicrobiota bacterium]
MRPLTLIITLACAALAATLSSCSSPSVQSGGWDARLGPVPVEQKVTPAQLLSEVRLIQDMIPRGTYGRRIYRPMNVRYITIHATENPTGDAWHHALALKRGALRANKRPGGNRIGFLTWHFTVEDRDAYQHLPTNEQGEHADFDGPGNNYSIAIEMCEHHGNDLARTIDNTAKLAAFLMYEHRLGIGSVVPHHHWRRIGVSPEHKDCPHFLLDRGNEGPTWRWFLDRVQAQYSRIIPGPVPRI